MKFALALVLLSSFGLVPSQAQVHGAGGRATGQTVAATDGCSVVGRVLGPGARPARGVTVTTSAGGETVTGSDGSFALTVDVPTEAESIDVMATAKRMLGGMQASVRIVPSSGSIVHVGALVLRPVAGPGARWLPTFGGLLGADEAVHDMTAFDDGSGPALYIGGDFLRVGGVQATYLVKWDGSRLARIGSEVDQLEPTGFAGVRAFATFDDGRGPALYVGGDFGRAGGITTRSVGRWDGTSWEALGSGLDGDVYALAVFDDGSGPALHAGGSFGFSGATVVNRIAKWDGSSWIPLGSGIDGFTGVLALTTFDDGNGEKLYAGGQFTTAGGVVVNGIACWDGSSWSALGGGVDHVVHALATFDDGSGPALYAGGSFTTAGGVGASRVARWDGATWSAVGSGTDGTVRELKVLDDGSGPALHAGGSFTSAGGVSAVRIAKWDGTSWSGRNVGPSGQVETLAYLGAGAQTGLVAGGTFSGTSGGSGASTVVRAPNLARFDGTAWSTLGLSREGLVGSVRSLATLDQGSGQELFAGGYFDTAGGKSVQWIARWARSGWETVGSGVDNAVLALASFDDGAGPAMYATGQFFQAGGSPALRIAKWDGSNWSALGSGLGLTGRCLAVFDDGSGPALYAGGDFSTAGGVPANHIAKWDGSSWSALGSGLNSDIFALTVFDDGSGPALYVGGSFTQAGGATVRRIARWDGSNWSSVGPLLTGGAVRALTVLDDGSGPALYAGGLFTLVNGLALNRVARWDGASWSPLGGGVNAVVHTLSTLDDGSGPALYVGGEFTTAGGVAAKGLARWDGSNWTTLGAGVGQTVGAPVVHALTVLDDGTSPSLCVGGDFEISPARDANLARWGNGKRVGLRQKP